MADDTITPAAPVSKWKAALVWLAAKADAALNWVGPKLKSALASVKTFAFWKSSFTFTGKKLVEYAVLLAIVSFLLGHHMVPAKIVTRTIAASCPVVKTATVSTPAKSKAKHVVKATKVSFADMRPGSVFSN